MTTSGNGEYQEVLDQLFTDGVLVDLDVEFWRAQRANTKLDLGLVEDEELPGFVAGLGTKRLLPKEEIARWRQYADNARYAIEKRSFPFPMVRGRFVPASRIEELEKELAQLKADFEQAVEDFLRNYSKRREEYLAQYPEHRQGLKWPPRAALEGHFSFTWTMYSLTVPKAVKKNLFDKAAQARYEKRLEAQVNEFVRTVVTELRGKTADLCKSVSERIEAGEVVTQTSLNRIQRFVDEYRAFNFVGDVEVERSLDTLKTAIGSRTSRDYQTDEAARGSLAQALTAALKVAGTIKDVDQITGQYRRRLKIEPKKEG